MSRHAAFPAGVYKITFGTAAANANYVVSLITQTSGTVKVWDNTAYSGLPTTGWFYIVVYNISNALADQVVHFTVSAGM